MTQADYAVTWAKKRLPKYTKPEEVGDYIKNLFVLSVDYAEGNTILEKIKNISEGELAAFFKKIDDIRKTGKSYKACMESILTDFFDLFKPFYHSSTGAFQSLMKIRGDIFERIVEEIFKDYDICYKNINKKTYPDFFVYSDTSKTKIIGFVTCKHSLRERYRQAIKEKENMAEKGNGNLPFYLVSMEDNPSSSTLEDLKDSSVVHTSPNTFNDLIETFKA